MSQKIPNIQNLHIEKNIKESIKNEMFNIVLKRCIEEINYTNSFTDKTYIIFEIPNIIIGFHNYDKLSCVTYLMHQFIQKEYLVQFIEPNKLYIDWGTNTSKFSNLQNLIPTSNPIKLKNQTRELLKKYPTATKIVYEYEDKHDSKKKKKK